jgi:hypothetical protein
VQRLLLIHVCYLSEPVGLAYPCSIFTYGANVTPWSIRLDKLPQSLPMQECGVCNDTHIIRWVIFAECFQLRVSHTCRVSEPKSDMEFCA